jgi:hypothetical protein
MAGDPWSTPLLFGAAVLLMVFVTLGLLPRMIRTGVQTTRLYCPWVRREVVVRHLTDEAGDPIGVISCTGLADPAAVTCERRCLARDGQGERTETALLSD